MKMNFEQILSFLHDLTKSEYFTNHLYIKHLFSNESIEDPKKESIKVIIEDFNKNINDLYLPNFLLKNLESDYIEYKKKVSFLLKTYK